MLTHGFVVDDKGEKMSKSVGNDDLGREGHRAVRRRRLAAVWSPAWTTPTTSGSASAASRRCRRPIARSATRSATCWATSRITRSSTRRASIPASLHEIDRWALGQLNAVIRDVRGRVRAIRVLPGLPADLPVLSRSSFRASTSTCSRTGSTPRLPHGPDRRAAQFVLARLHDALTRLLAPIIPHTAEESWDYLPAGPHKPASVHLAEFPQPDPRWDDSNRDARWQTLLEARETVLRALETLRKNKTIGSAQEAVVTLSADPADLALLEANRELLTRVCIVSDIKLEPAGSPSSGPARFSATAARSPHAKCERCWNYWPSVGQNAEHPTLCERCVGVIGGGLALL